jgi:hypothetical protein
MQRTFTGIALAFAAALAAAAQPTAGPKPAAAAAATQATAGPKLGAVLQEQVALAGRAASAPAAAASAGGHVLKPLPEKAYSFEDGEYRSVVSGVSLKLPQLRDEKVVSVREAVVIRRANGDVETSHVMFVPGTDGSIVDRFGPVSVVVVTRLQEGRPHDRETVLKAWEPRTPEQRKQMEARGVEFHRIKTGLGEGLERIVPNRIADENFPYRTHMDEGVRKVQSVGVTRYLVSTDRALLEFSQVFPCRDLAGDACREAALKASDHFVQGVSTFVLVNLPAKPASAAASAGK